MRHIEWHYKLDGWFHCFMSIEHIFRMFARISLLTIHIFQWHNLRSYEFSLKMSQYIPSVGILLFFIIPTMFKFSRKKEAKKQNNLVQSIENRIRIEFLFLSNIKWVEQNGLIKCVTKNLIKSQDKKECMKKQRQKYKILIFW